MDATHGALGLIGLAGGLWLRSSGNKEATEVRPCQCQCLCSSEDKGQTSNLGPWFLLLVIVGLLFANLALVFRVTIRRNEAGDQEVTLAVKGKPGKGLYGLQQGLQILEQ